MTMTLLPAETKLTCAENLRAALAAYESQPADADVWTKLLSARREFAAEVAAFPPGQKSGGSLDEARALLRELAKSSIQGRETVGEDLARAQEWGRGKWPGMLAAMALVPAWQWREAPTLSAVPDWLWPDYAAWWFAPPSAAHDATSFDAYVTGTSRHLDELARWLRRNPGSAAVRAAADAYVNVAARLPWSHATKCTRAYAELRGRFLTQYFGLGLPIAQANVLAQRVGRRLRVGFVQPRFGPGADLRSARPKYEHLDTRSFEPLLFSLSAEDQQYAEERGSAEPPLRVLAPDLATQLATLRSLALDIVVYGSDVLGRSEDITRLATQRVAPLQVAHDCGEFTTGIPAIDLQVVSERSGVAGVLDNYSERLGLLRGPAHTVALPLERAEAHAVPTRESIGLPPYVPLFFSVVTDSGVAADMLVNWAQILARVPGARLALVHVGQSGVDGEAAVTHFCQALGRAFHARGVAAERVSLFPVRDAGPEHGRNLLALADVYLDGAPANEFVWAVEAIVLGRAVVTTGGAHRLPAPALVQILESCGLGGLVAADPEAYVSLAAKLGQDVATRASWSARCQSAIDATPAFLDTLAASDAFGALLETAFDELVALGPTQFRAQREPLRCFAPPDVSEAIAAGEVALAAGDYETAGAEAVLALRAEPTNLAARILRGRALLPMGDTARAITYLLAAVGSGSNDAAVWLALATALRQNGQAKDAIHALETALRLDRSCVEGWLMLLDMAESAGVPELAEDARTVLREVAPDDPRVFAMA